MPHRGCEKEYGLQFKKKIRDLIKNNPQKEFELEQAAEKLIYDRKKGRRRKKKSNRPSTRRG